MGGGLIRQLRLETAARMALAGFEIAGREGEARRRSAWGWQSLHPAYVRSGGVVHPEPLVRTRVEFVERVISEVTRAAQDGRESTVSVSLVKLGCRYKFTRPNSVAAENDIDEFLRVQVPLWLQFTEPWLHETATPAGCLRALDSPRTPPFVGSVSRHSGPRYLVLAYMVGGPPAVGPAHALWMPRLRRECERNLDAGEAKDCLEELDDLRTRLEAAEWPVPQASPN